MLGAITVDVVGVPRSTFCFSDVVTDLDADWSIRDGVLAAGADVMIVSAHCAAVE